MPSINNGRVSTDGSGTVSLKGEETATGIGVSLSIGSTSSSSSSSSSKSGVSSVSARNIGEGQGLFAGRDGTYDVVLNLKTLNAGPGIGFDVDDDSITIKLNESTRRVSFLSLLEAPAAITKAGFLFGTADGKLAFTRQPTQAGSVPTFNGIDFDWRVPQTGFTSIDLTGDDVIGVSHTAQGTAVAFQLNAKPSGVSAGTYTAATLTVDKYGRVVGAVSTPVGETNTGLNLGSGKQVFAGKVGSALQFKTLKAGGIIQAVETSSDITFTTNAVTSVGLVALAGITVQGGAITSSGSFAVGLANSGVTPGTYNLVTVDSYGRVVSASNSSPSAPISATNIGTGSGLFATQNGNNLNLKSLIGGGIVTVTPGANALTLSANAVTSVGLDAGTGITVAGGTITSVGRFSVGLANSGVTPGTYTLAQITVDGTGRVTAASSGVASSSKGANLDNGDAQIYASTVGSNINFRALKAGSNIILSQDANTVTVAASLPPQTLLSVKSADNSVQAPNTVLFTVGTGLTLTSQGQGAARLDAVAPAPQPTLTIQDEAGNSVTTVANISLVGLTLVNEAGVAKIVAPAQSGTVASANAAISDGTTAILNPQSVRFVGAQVSQDGKAAVVTIPQASGGLSGLTFYGSSAGNVYGQTTYANIGQVYVDGLTVTPVNVNGANTGILLSNTFQGLAVGHDSTVDASRIQTLLFSGANVKVDGTQATVTYAGGGSTPTPVSDAMLLHDDQTATGNKTFSNSITVGQSLLVEGFTTLTKAVSVQDALSVNNGITVKNGLTVTSGTITLNQPSVTGEISALVANGGTAAGQFIFDQVARAWKVGPGQSFAGNLTGRATSAGTADKLANAAKIQLTGAVTGIASFDGSANAQIVTTLGNTGITPGQYSNPSIMVSADGRITQISGGGYSRLDTVGTNVSSLTQDRITGDFTNLTFVGANGVVVSSTTTDVVISVDPDQFGTVKAVALNAAGGIVVTGTTITDSGAFTVGLANTTVVPGTYTNASITVDQYGRISLASNGTGSTSGSADTAANIGTGDAHLFAQKVDSEFQFRSLVAGQNITLTETGTTVTIAAANASGLSAVTISDGNSSINATAIYVSGGTISQGEGSTEAVITIPAGTDGTVKSINARSSDGTLNVTGGPITTTGTFDITLPAVGVTAGTYNYATITVDAQGRVTAASQNAAPTGTAGGTVTSVAVASSDLVVSGSPITTSGTINLALGTSGVAPGTYGSAAQVGTFTVDSKGRITNAGVTAIAIPSSAISDATAANTPNTVVERDGSGNFSAGTITASLAGNASTATKLATARNISLAQDVTGTGVFDGSADLSVNVTLANSGVAAGTYTYATITVDAKGRVTSATAGAAPTAPTLKHSDVVTVTNAATATYSFQASGSALTLNPNFLMVYLNRMLMRPSEYSVSGNSVTFSVALNTQDEIEVVTA